MSKIKIILLLIGLVSCQQEVKYLEEAEEEEVALELTKEDIDINKYYAAIISFWKELCTSGQYKCSEAFKKGQSKIATIINNAIKEIKSGKDASSTIKSAAVKLVLVSGVAINCKLTDLISKVLDKFKSKEGYRTIFKALKDGVDEVYNGVVLIQNYRKSKDLDDLGKGIGKIFKTTFDFTVK